MTLIGDISHGAGLLQRYGDSVGSVAVLSPYKAQVGALRALFQARHGAHNLTSVTFATIDGFQVRASRAVTCTIEVMGTSLLMCSD